MKKAFFFITLSTFYFLLSTFVLAESCSTSCPDNDLDKCMAECQKLINISVGATKPHEQTAAALEKDIADIDANIKILATLIEKKKAVIEEGNLKFATQQTLLDSQIRDFYKKNWTSPAEYFLATIFSTEEVGQTLNNLAYRQNLIDQQKKFITSLVAELSNLNTQKKQLEENQNWLEGKIASLKVTLAPIRDLVNRAKAYQSQLTQTLGNLSSRQQALIAARLGSLNLSRSASISMACADDRKIDPGFGTGFAFYTFGIPHRVGMSQFGAYGRAKDGKNYEEILRAYYNFDNFQDFEATIRVSDGGINWSGSLEDYVKRIYEVPGDWPMAVLKAQAIAARSYALAYTDRGSGSICASQSCQVFKTEPKGGAWDQAVNETSKKAMVVGGSPIKAWFSSTDGGYTHTSADVFGGDTSWTKNTRDANGDVNNLSDLFSKAYDRESPCFYNAQGWRTQYSKSAWLKPEEVADIVNVIMLASFDGSADTYDEGKVKNELRNRGQTPFNKIDNVSLSFDLGYGKTTSINFSGDAGSRSFNGKIFKDYFNIRAPANIAIVGPLFNVEKR